MQVLDKQTTNLFDLEGLNYCIRANDILLFDNYEEYSEYFQSIQYGWDKESYIQKVSSIHDELFKSYYEIYGYEGKDEIPLWFDSLKYGEEAKALSDWYCSTWETLENHFEIVTENTADAEQIIKSLPPFQINKS